MKKLLGFLAFVCLLARPALAADRTFATCAAADVQAAFNSAQNGDRVFGPTQSLPTLGTATWTEQVQINAPENVTYSIGCIITDNYKPPQGSSSLLTIGVPPNGKFQLTGGFTVKADAANSTYKYALITVYSQNKQFRIDNFRCDTTQGAFPQLNYAVPTCLMFWGQVNGVIDHSEFTFGDSGGGAFVIHGDGEGDLTWSEPTGLGGPNFLFFEDNKMNNATSRYSAVNDCYHGGRWVVRYNKVQKAGVQTHPTGGSGRARGCRAWEVYKNEFLDNAGPPHFNVGFISSGAGVIWGNSAPSGFSNFLTLHSMRINANTYPQYPVPDGWGFFQSVYDQPGSPLDQPGKGRSDLLSGAFPNVKNETRNCMVSQPNCFTPAQVTEGLYEWDNVWSGPGGGSKIANYEGNVLLPNRDYFPDTKMPGYVPYAYPHPLVTGVTPIPPIPPTLPTLSVSDAQVSEAAGTATVAVTKTGAGVASVAVRTTDGTAGGADYTTVVSTLSFADTDTTKTVVVPITQDATVEPNETFTVNLSTPTGATILDGQGTVTIVNDDTAPVPTVPSPPTGVTAVSGGQTTATVNWVDSSADETGFAVQRCMGAACTSFAEIGRTAANVASYPDSGLTAGTAYRYRVMAFNAAGSSAASNIAEITTAPTTPIPPEPPNQAPAVTIVSPTPGQNITVNKFDIKANGLDDTGIAWWEIYINGQLWFAGPGGIDSITRQWNTSPYKRKAFTIGIRGKDAEGLWSPMQTVSGTVKQ